MLFYSKRLEMMKIEPLCLPGSRYPLFLVEDLDTKRPNKVQLLGKNIVVWQAPNGSWSALEDLCPHRLAPLSGTELSFWSWDRF